MHPELLAEAINGRSPWRTGRGNRGTTMPPKKNPLKLNKLQLRTLTVAQLLAEDPSLARRDETTGVVTLLQIPHAHGDHIHIGRFAVSTREASGLRSYSLRPCSANMVWILPSWANMAKPRLKSSNFFCA